MFNKKNQLQIPEAAFNDSESFEIVRVWIANKAQHVTLKTGVWEDPAAWGIMLSDLARHIANIYAQTEGRNAVEVLDRIRAGFDAEMESPTDTPSGSLAGRSG